MWLVRICVVLVAVIAAQAGPASAAVRLCGRPVLGSISQAATAEEARRVAITSWSVKAARLGREFTSWRLAIRKRYSCGRLKDGRHSCIAFASPCRIVQKPPVPGQPQVPGQRQLPMPGPKLKPPMPGNAPREI